MATRSARATGLEHARTRCRYRSRLGFAFPWHVWPPSQRRAFGPPLLRLSVLATRPAETTPHLVGRRMFARIHPQRMAPSANGPYPSVMRHGWRRALAVPELDVLTGEGGSDHGNASPSAERRARSMHRSAFPASVHSGYSQAHSMAYSACSRHTARSLSSSITSCPTR